jgi:hypothetical protein
MNPNCSGCFKAVLFSCLLPCIGAALASEVVGLPRSESATLRAREVSGEVPRRYQEILGLRLEIDSLATVKSKYGSTKEFSFFGENSQRGICYMVGQGETRYVVFFEAGALGSRKRLTGYGFIEERGFTPGTSNCASESTLPSNVLDVFPIRVGQARDSISSAVQFKPIYESEREIEWALVKDFSRKGREAQVLSGLRLTFSKGSVNGVFVRRAIAY